MPKFIRALCLLLMMALLPWAAAAGLNFTWQEGESFYPQQQEWTYRYRYRYPVAQGEGLLPEALNTYFDLALNEMQKLVLPMYAEDPIMGTGQNSISEHYDITRQDDDIISFLLTREQSMGEEALLSLSAAVFAASGEYAGQTLTLRGLVMVGESSAQLGEAVLKDVWRQIGERISQGEAGWKQGLDEGMLRQGFYPETSFYGDKDGRAVFFLQPGEFREDKEIVVFAYTPEELEALIGA